MKAEKAEGRRWVVDSSFACALFLPDEKSDAVDSFFQQILTDEIHAPALLKYEVANALRGAIRRKRIVDNEAKELLSMFLDLPIIFDPLHNSNRPTQILELATHLDLSVYDASYIELCSFLSASLLTLDENMTKAAKKRKIKTATV